MKLNFHPRYPVFKLLCLFCMLILISGCRTTFKSSWKNFNAYYNTFYNAEQSYKLGEDKNLGQGREYNPLQPIRIHQVPLNAGAQDFDKAIEKGADILRKHQDSKWVDDALFLIGKSYYFKKEYFSAEQKFQELFVTTENTDLKQKSIFWRGRVLLDMERHTEALAYLSDMLSEFEEEWIRSNRAETKIILAQHHVGLENWEQAATHLREALPHLSSKEYRERGYFLLGQIFELLDDPEAAFEAYSKVKDHYHEYRLQYLAKRKQAEVARTLGRHNVASRLFNEMIRDDKNIEYKSELDFELARTEHRRGNYTRAEQIYKNILRNQLTRPSPEITARTYYGLAEIYRYDYNNFAMAATYYDSAAQRNVPAERLPPNFAAKELAESFGNYARLTSEIAIQDSLLWLGQLEPAEFDSVIAVVRAQKIAELEQLREEEERRQNTMVNVEQDVENEDVSDLRNGFLNSDNPVLQQNARIQFLAVWGDRPLADYWRVRSLIRNPQSDEELDEAQVGAVNTGEDMIFVEIDLSRIPFTAEEQDSVRKQIAAYQYQLGNLFFLSLNMPDSAAHYFEKAVRNPSNPNVTLVSLYSLAELYAIEGNDLKAREYASTLIDNYPHSGYARRLAETYSFTLNTSDSAEIDTVQVFNSIAGNDSILSRGKAEELKMFAESFTDHKLAAQAQWMAIQLYLEEGKKRPDYSSKINQWLDALEQRKLDLKEFELLQDSAQIMINDTTLSEDSRAYYAGLIDSTLAEPDLTEYFPYTGEAWDSARTAIEVYLENFSGTVYEDKVRILQNEIDLPETEEEPAKQDEAQKISTDETAEGYRNCTEIDAEMKIRGGLQQFLARIELPDEVSVSEITYLFMINQRGIIDDYRLISENISKGVVSSFQSGFENLSFEPVLENGQAVPVQCEFTFPLVQ